MQRVLIADDEKLLADTLVLIFRNAGYDARAAYSLQDVLAATRPTCPDLAIIDVFLGSECAIDAAIGLRQRGCAIVLISGHVDTTELLLQIKARGYTDFTIFPKPIAPAELLQRVRRILDTAPPQGQRAA